MRVKISRRGSDVGRALDSVSKLKSIYSRVGIHATKGATVYAETGATLIEVAIWNHFGTPRAKHPIPPRPFLTQPFDQNQKELLYSMGDVLKAATRDIASSNSKLVQQKIDRGLAKVGRKMAELSRHSIKQRAYTANAPFTIAQKRSDVPLIETGKLIEAIESKTRRKK